MSVTMPTKTITSVTCFLHVDDEYLFVHRTKKGNATDSGRLNGIGGKLQPGEDFLSAALRETNEETGYEVSEADCRLRALVTMTGGYPEDWVMGFFSIQVPTKRVPRGMENEEGELLWLPKSAVLTSSYELVDDLHYCWEFLASTDPRILFAGCVMDENQRVRQWQSRLLPVLS